MKLITAPRQHVYVILNDAYVLMVDNKSNSDEYLRLIDSNAVSFFHVFISV